MKNNKFLLCLISLQVLLSCTPMFTKKIDIQYPNFNNIDEKCKKEYEEKFLF